MPPVKPIPDGYDTLTPYLIVGDAAGAIAFYAKAFGATERMRLDAPGGRIGHAELTIGNSVIMLADEHPEMGALSPASIGGTPIGLHLYVADVDAVTERAVAAGGKVLQAPETKFYGDRNSTLEDPFGHRWFISTHVEDVAPDEIARRAAAAQGQQQ
ncbi:MAG: VOC family protein [Alphaproteobacteria bacterium]